MKVRNQKTKTVDYCLLLDRSGSMLDLKNSVVDGFNEQLDAIEDIDGDVNVSLFQFYTGYDYGDPQNFLDVVFRQSPVSEVEELTENDYTPGGRTPLNDAIGEVIEMFEDREDVVLVVFTDGLENSSTEYNKSQIENLISDREDNGWKVEFIGTENIKEFAQSYGASKTTIISNDSSGIKDMYRSSMQTVSAYTEDNS